MKLNFWQWLGIILVVLAGGFWIYEKTSNPDIAKAPPPATQPR